jgi:hypothetical protein
LGEVVPSGAPQAVALEIQDKGLSAPPKLSVAGVSLGRIETAGYGLGSHPIENGPVEGGWRRFKKQR